MWKNILRAMPFVLAAALASANEASVKKAFETAYPDIKVDSVTRTPFTGLYEVVMGADIVYTDEGVNYLFMNGSLIDIKARRDLTGPRRDELEERNLQQHTIDFNSLPLEQAIKIVRGKGSRKMAVFSDPDCPYCHRLEREELSQIKDVTIYTFLFPLAGHRDAPRKAKAIWCSPDRAKAWEDWMLRGKLAEGSASCQTPMEKNVELGFKLDVDATPTLFFASGRRLAGAYPAERIEKELQTNR